METKILKNAETNKSTTERKPLSPTRLALITTSELARAIRKEFIGDSETDENTLNHYIVNHIYKVADPEITEFKTFGQWKEEGAIIIKGSKAFPVWGQPRKIDRDKTGTPNKELTDDEKMEFFPMANLFSNKQVYFPSERIITRTDREPPKIENLTPAIVF